VDIVLMVWREVVVHHVGAAIHIDTTSGDICSHKHADLSLAEFIERAESLVLGAV
jgi:hypothetical protein